MSDQPAIRVFVVDDHPLVRSGVRSELEGRVDVVGTAGDVDEAVTGIAAAAPDVVLVDVHMPGGGGAELIRRVLRRAMRAADPDGAAPPGSWRCRSPTPPRTSSPSSGPGPGATSPRPCRAPSWPRPSAGWRPGDAVFSPRLAGFVLDAFAGTMPLPSDPELDQLTAREREVLRLIARGYAYKEVARRLNLSVKTVETHVSSVLRKLQLSSRHELTRWATERRLV